MEVIYIIIGLVVGALGGILYSRKATNSKANFIIKDAKQLPSKGLLNGAPSSCRITESRNKLKSC